MVLKGLAMGQPPGPDNAAMQPALREVPEMAFHGVWYTELLCLEARERDGPPSWWDSDTDHQAEAALLSHNGGQKGRAL